MWWSRWSLWRAFTGHDESMEIALRTLKPAGKIHPNGQRGMTRLTRPLVQIPSDRGNDERDPGDRHALSSGRTIFSPRGAQPTADLAERGTTQQRRFHHHQQILGAECGGFHLRERRLDPLAVLT